MKKFTGVVLVLIALVFLVVIIVRGVTFGINCGGHMGRAANANSIGLAKQEMEIVVKYLEYNNLTNGNTSVLWDTPSQDLGFFYKNMKDSLVELQSIKDTATPLEKSNVLMKLRETLTHHGDKSTSITVPWGISLAPHNVLFAVWGVISVLIAIVGCALFVDDSY
ncbi:MAG: hypothetical protein WC631_03710 [Candidatus Paceibacterota bacterium]|jgi:hypothetical protein